MQRKRELPPSSSPCFTTLYIDSSNGATFIKELTSSSMSAWPSSSSSSSYAVSALFPPPLPREISCRNGATSVVEVGGRICRSGRSYLEI